MLCAQQRAVSMSRYWILREKKVWLRPLTETLIGVGFWMLSEDPVSIILSSIADGSQYSIQIVQKAGISLPSPGLYSLFRERFSKYSGE